MSICLFGRISMDMDTDNNYIIASSISVYHLALYDIPPLESERRAQRKVKWYNETAEMSREKEKEKMRTNEDDCVINGGTHNVHECNHIHA